MRSHRVWRNPQRQSEDSLEPSNRIQEAYITISGFSPLPGRTGAAEHTADADLMGVSTLQGEDAIPSPRPEACAGVFSFVQFSALAGPHKRKYSKKENSALPARKFKLLM